MWILYLPCTTETQSLRYYVFTEGLLCISIWWGLGETVMLKEAMASAVKGLTIYWISSYKRSGNAYGEVLGNILMTYNTWQIYWLYYTMGNLGKQGQCSGYRNVSSHQSLREK